MKKSSRGIGLLKTIFLIAAIILVLSYIGIDVRRVIESDQSKKNFGYVKAVTVTVWERYLKNPAKYVYYDIWLDLIWHPTTENLKKLRNGEETNIQKMAPKVLDIKIPKYDPEKYK